ncbi:GIY-YIG nuclease family protein [Allosphingosinicella vermicomposti]|uniref:GIY-YIG nuclease family protein n=1 Tax=Allosphingosinicella vermicomposti TaxID=614671 RepID=UPI000D0EFA42|nr:GIY-YIG nuclease family protein [Allosphingosinicella vermicomposti]
MHYVYLIEGAGGARYVGCTNDLKRRLAEHNAGESSHTKRLIPWQLVTYIAFQHEQSARAFEAYLKHGSGHAFAKRHFWTRPAH